MYVSEDLCEINVRENSCVSNAGNTVLMDRAFFLKHNLFFRPARCGPYLLEV